MRNDRTHHNIVQEFRVWRNARQKRGYSIAHSVTGRTLSNSQAAKKDGSCIFPNPRRIHSTPRLGPINKAWERTVEELRSIVIVDIDRGDSRRYEANRRVDKVVHAGTGNNYLYSSSK